MEELPYSYPENATQGEFAPKPAPTGAFFFSPALWAVVPGVQGQRPRRTTLQPHRGARSSALYPLQRHYVLHARLRGGCTKPAERSRTMPYAIMRFAKSKGGGGAGGLDRHHERKKDKYLSNPDIDTARSYENYHIIEPHRPYRDEIKSRIEDAGCKVRKDNRLYHC